MHGQPGHDKLHDRTPHYHPISWAWKTSQLNVALIRKLRRSLMGLDYYFDMISMGVCTHRQSDHRSSGAGIKCLQCFTAVAGFIKTI